MKDEIKKLKELINDIQVAMLTTVDDNGELRSRPMATTTMEDDGIIYFFTYVDSPKTNELNHNHHVNVSYMDRDDQKYVSVSGFATVVKDQKKINELWSPVLKAWFPKGKEDPSISLLKVEVTKAEYWDTPGSKMVQLIGMAKATLTKEPYQPGENKKITLK